MSEPDTVQLSGMTNASRRRRRIRTGFGLVVASLALTLAYIVASWALSATLTEEQKHADVWQLSQTLVDATTSGLIIAGLVFLYRVQLSQRWRLSCSLLLALLGLDVAFLTLRIAGASAPILALCNLLGGASNWIELWLLAVVAAEAAEATERPDLTHQTEVVGKLIIAGAFAWILWGIWSFDPAQLTESSPPIAADAFAAILNTSVVVLEIVILIRTLLCCAGLVTAYAPNRGESPSS